MSIVVGGKFNRILNQITVFLVIFVNGLRGEDCGPEALEKCAAPFNLISSVPGMSMAAQKRELDEMCPDLYGGMICIRSYTRRCMSLGQRSHFLKLFHGTQQVVRELCRDGPLQHEFLRHSPCLKSVNENYKQCASNYHDALTQVQLEQSLANNNHTSNLVCCSFRDYVSCSESVVYDKCGREASEFTKKFMNQMTSPMIKEYCEMSDYAGCGQEYKVSGGSSSLGQKRVLLQCGVLLWLLMLVKMCFFTPTRYGG